TAVRSTPADRGGGVRPHDGRDPAVSDHAPLLDAVEEAHGSERQRPRVIQRMHAELPGFDRIGPGELLDIVAAEAGLGNVGRGHGAGGDDRVDPRAGDGHRVRSAQPRYVMLRSSVRTRRLVPSPPRAIPFISCATMSLRASFSVSSAGVMNRWKSWKPSGMVCCTYSSSHTTCRKPAMVRLWVRNPSPPPGARTAATPARVRSRSPTCSSTSTANTRSYDPSSPGALRFSAVPGRYSIAKPARCAWSRAAVRERSDGSMPVTRAPSVARASARMPPPHPTSSTRLPPNPLNTARKYSTRTTFNSCSPANGPASLHHSPGTRSTRRSYFSASGRPPRRGSWSDMRD